MLAISRAVLSQQAVGVLVAAALPADCAALNGVDLHAGGNALQRLWPDICLPWSHVRERRSCWAICGWA